MKKIEDNNTLVYILRFSSFMLLSINTMTGWLIIPCHDSRSSQFSMARESRLREMREAEESTGIAEGIGIQVVAPKGTGHDFTETGTPLNY